MAVLRHLQRSAATGRHWSEGVSQIPGASISRSGGRGITGVFGLPGIPNARGGATGVPGMASGFTPNGGGGAPTQPSGTPWWWDEAKGAAGWLAGQFGGSDGDDETPGDNLVPGSGGGPCPDGSFSVMGRCFDLRPGGGVQGGGMVLSHGEPVLGIYGVAMVPTVEDRTVRRCMAGMVLGKDGLCYERLNKSQRAHPPGRKPLMTGGDLNAISRAARVAGKLKRKNRELKRLGLLK